MPRRPCLTPDCPNLTNRGPRCTTCERDYQRRRNANRPQYAGSHDRRAAEVRANATVCWLCGEGPRPDDPWQADHVIPADPRSELRPAHRSCNARRGNRVLQDEGMPKVWSDQAS